MTLEEIEERVKHSLEALNSPEELYDWRLTHYNQLAWENVQEGCYMLSENKLSELDLKSLIKAYRDRSEISHIDFRIKVAEPSKDDFKRMALLFGVKVDVRLLPPRDEGDRRAYTQLKTLEAVSLAVDHKQVISEKLRQQFTYFMLRAAIKTPELLAVHLKLEGHNPYHKHLSPAPTVKLRNHFVKPETPDEIPAPAPAPAKPMFAHDAIDNSSFESRLPPSVGKAARAQKTRPPQAYRPEQIVVVDMEPNPETPHELPAEIHEEFAAYCEILYEKAKGN